MRRAWVAILSGGLACAQHATAEIVTQIESATVAAGATASLRPACGEGAIAIGGGAEPETIFSVSLRSSGPAFGATTPGRLAFQSNGQQGAPSFWFAAVENLGVDPFAWNAAAICASGASAVTVVTSVGVPEGGSGTARALCPEGSVAVGGGFDPTIAADAFVASTAPVFGPDIDDTLQFIPDGEAAAPRGWEATVRKSGGSTGMTLKVAAICSADFSVRTQVASFTADAFSYDGVRVSCPEGWSASSGGIAPEDPAGMEIESNAPVFGPDPDDILIDQPAGSNPAPTGWLAWGRSIDVDSHVAKVAAVCVRVPEPEPGLTAIGAALALALLARRSRRGVSFR